MFHMKVYCPSFYYICKSACWS